jgi:hypothetical protein
MSKSSKVTGRVFHRHLYPLLYSRLSEDRRFIQVLSGPRQVGKTTLARQIGEGLGEPVHYVSADEPTLQDRAWLAQQWEVGRSLALSRGTAGPALLMIDEVQKIAGWSETVKRLWDEDTHSGTALKVMLLGSSPLLVQQGLTESLAGRFEITPVPHWSFPEMREAFGWSLEQFLYFGGYPGSAALIGDEERWRRYIIDALIETTISRDILLLSRVDKPALLRRLFHLACEYSGQILSYQKMTGQLQDAGNTTTLAHYLDLLHGAGLVAGLQKYAGEKVRQRGSSPKLQVLNTALMTALGPVRFADLDKDPEFKGRLVESAVGAHLLNTSRGAGVDIQYWLDRNREVDFVLVSGRAITAIEVKSTARRANPPGVDAFMGAFPSARPLLVGAQGIPIAEFLTRPALDWATALGTDQSRRHV